MMVIGKSPFGTFAKPLSTERIQSWAGGTPKYPACEAFGREPSLVGAIGVPPEWNDKGADAGQLSTAQAR